MAGLSVFKFKFEYFIAEFAKFNIIQNKWPQYPLTLFNHNQGEDYNAKTLGVQNRLG